MSEKAFQGILSSNTIVDTGEAPAWNVSSVTQMNHMFRDCFVITPDLSSWNVLSVTNFNNMKNKDKENLNVRKSLSRHIR